jgi:hypothetical protein
MSTSCRIEAGNLLQQRYDRVVDIYSGHRNTFPLSDIDDRSLVSAASIIVGVRKTF